jgi:hypothetical protein
MYPKYDLEHFPSTPDCDLISRHFEILFSELSQLLIAAVIQTK